MGVVSEDIVFPIWGLMRVFRGLEMRRFGDFHLGRASEATRWDAFGRNPSRLVRAEILQDDFRSP
jgi:hypothetical protein